MLLVRRLGLSSVWDLRTQGLVSLVREPADPGLSFWRPRIRFRTKPLRQCPFLLNDVGEDGVYRGLCSLHPHEKPLVCLLSPLSRAVVDPGTGMTRESWSFIPPVEGCPGVGKGGPVTVESPPALRPRLEAEVLWMRWLVGATRDLPDVEDAWKTLAGEPQIFNKSE